MRCERGLTMTNGAVFSATPYKHTEISAAVDVFVGDGRDEVFCPNPFGVSADV